MAGSRELVPVDAISNLIHVVRGHRVMLDSDFAFRLTAAEGSALRSQIATSNVGRGGRRYAPLVFTEHGAVMLASVLNSSVAIATSIQVVRAFIRLRAVLAANVDLARKLAAMEAKYDGQFGIVFQAIRELIEPTVPPRKRIGFHATPEEPSS